MVNWGILSAVSSAPGLDSKQNFQCDFGKILTLSSSCTDVQHVSTRPRNRSTKKRIAALRIYNQEEKMSSLITGKLLLIRGLMKDWYLLPLEMYSLKMLEVT